MSTEEPLNGVGFYDHSDIKFGLSVVASVKLAGATDNQNARDIVVTGYDAEGNPINETVYTPVGPVVDGVLQTVKGVLGGDRGVAIFDNLGNLLIGQLSVQLASSSTFPNGMTSLIPGTTNTMGQVGNFGAECPLGTFTFSYNSTNKHLTLTGTAPWPENDVVTLTDLAALGTLAVSFNAYQIPINFWTTDAITADALGAALAGLTIVTERAPLTPNPVANIPDGEGLTVGALRDALVALGLMAAAS